MKVAIIGSGPSSMFGVMACNDNGIEPHIYRKEGFNSPFGAFYYHWLPESYIGKVDLHDIEYTYLGTEEVYLRNQWGDNTPNESSFGKYSFELGFNPMDVDSVFVKHAKYYIAGTNKLEESEITELCNIYDIVFCTFPFKAYKDKAEMTFRPVVRKQSRFPEDYNMITYNGTSKYKWVRRSELFGSQYTEYTTVLDISNNEGTLSFVPDLAKDLSISYEGLPDNLLFVGRFAQMKRKLLSHQSYHRVMEAINAIKNMGATKELQRKDL